MSEGEKGGFVRKLWLRSDLRGLFKSSEDIQEVKHYGSAANDDRYY